MPIDYSKWNKIELSDDSDIEVHPNIDKRSFIKWKQRDIHEKREQRNSEIKSIVMQSTMYTKLNSRVDFILQNILAKDILNENKVREILNEKFSDTEKFDYDELIREKGEFLQKTLQDLVFDEKDIESTIPYNHMIFDLFKQIKEDNKESSLTGEQFFERLNDHRKKIEQLMKTQSEKLEELIQKKSLLISSEDIHYGFNSTLLNKVKSEKTGDKSLTKKIVTSTEIINNPTEDKIVKTESIPNNEKEFLEDFSLDPQTEKFAQIPINKIQESAKFLMDNPHICNEQQKDALIMKAFDLNLKDDEKIIQIIHQSLMIQYISQLSGISPTRDQNINTIKLFCYKISDHNSAAYKGFLYDVNKTYNHIKKRRNVIRKEQEINNKDEKTEEASIQLKSLDEDEELQIEIPIEGTPEHEIFVTKLSKELQDAINTRSLEIINKELGKLKIEEAEEVLNVFNECKVIKIQGYFQNENEFNNLLQKS